VDLPQTVTRQRRRTVPNPYNPDSPIPGSWDEPLDEQSLPGSWISSSSSIAPASATRSQIITAKSLFCSDPSVDVQAGDRIIAPGGPYYVHVRPEADVHPFTGWQPPVEIPLELSEG